MILLEEGRKTLKLSSFCVFFSFFVIFLSFFGHLFVLFPKTVSFFDDFVGGRSQNIKTLEFLSFFCHLFVICLSVFQKPYHFLMILLEEGRKTLKLSSFCHFFVLCHLFVLFPKTVSFFDDFVGGRSQNIKTLEFLSFFCHFLVIFLSFVCPFSKNRIIF